MKIRESKERKFEKKKKEKKEKQGELVVFAFLPRTVEVGRWQKLNEMFVFGILYLLE